ncbi:MAG: outer membrane beta-barrel protein [Chitinophagaceae bacterium]
MSHYLKIFLPVLFFFTTSAGQTNTVPPNNSIQGIVLSEEGDHLEGATVFLYRHTDSVLIKTSLTNAEGKYLFEELAPGNYFIRIDYVAKVSFSSAIITVSQTQKLIDVPPVRLKTFEKKALENVTVLSKRKFVEQKIDRTVINPDVLISNAGTTALEVLEKAPGVQVSIDGVISLKGSQGVLVYIDDKPTYMSSADLVSYLRSIPSGNIDVIELMTNPPAKYDAAGNAGIINIKLKKIKTMGFNGGINLSYGQGVYARSNNSFNFNYRINKINIFSNWGYTNNTSYQDLYINREYFTSSGDLSSAFNQNSFIKRHPKNVSGKLGIDIYLNKKLTVGAVLNGLSDVYRETTTNKAEILDQNLVLKNNVDAFSKVKRRWKNRSVNANFTYKLDSTGKELTGNFDHIYYSSKRSNSLLNAVYNPGGSLDNKTNLVSELPASIIINTAKLDLTHPLNNSSSFEAGIKTSFIRTTNTASFFDEKNATLTPNYDFTNSFSYKENINAAYVSYRFEGKRFSLQSGLRLENTNIKGYQFGNPTHKDSTFERKYTSLFPTVYVSYKLDSADVHHLGLSLGRRVDRPNYQDMNPFTYPMDRYTLYSGNPFLQPTYSYNAELSYTYKSNMTASFQYSFTNDVISETIEQNNGIFYSRPGNLGKQISYGLSITGTLPIKPWWNIQLYSELTHNRFISFLYGQRLNNRGSYYYISAVNLFQLGKLWNAELAGNYQSSVYVGQFITIPVGVARIALAKKIMKEKEL